MVVYKTTNLVNGKWYIGKDATNRPYYLGSGKILRAAIKKYGKSSFRKVVLDECSSLAELNYREKYWIHRSNALSDPNSYNLAAGGEGGDLSKFINYASIDRSNYKMLGTKTWFKSLTEEERKEFHAKQSKSRCKGWFVSKIDDPTETYVPNIAEWCKENGVGPDTVSRLTNPKHCLFQKQTKGWRFRKEGQPALEPYVNKQKLGHPNKTCKGKSWKTIDGKRVWIEQQKDSK